jgi:hypothetical protein
MNHVDEPHSGPRSLCPGNRETRRPCVESCQQPDLEDILTLPPECRVHHWQYSESGLSPHVWAQFKQFWPDRIERIGRSELARSSVA